MSTFALRTSVVLSLTLATFACSNSTQPSTAAAPNADEPRDPPAATAVTREALSFQSPCTASACGEVPASAQSSTPACAPTPDASCGWSDPDPNGTVSYGLCAPAACGAEPGAEVCPAGTVFKGSQCGSENDGPCTWTTACVPPPSTTPCPDANGCGLAQPAIGVVCKDGSVGDLACMKVGATCSWQPTCE